MSYFKSSYGNVYFEYYENESNTTLVFIGGLTQTTLSWAAVINELKNDFQCLVLDLIFQGQSEEYKEFLTFEQHAEVVHELCKYLNIKEYIPVGISYGGAVAMRLMVKYQEVIPHAVLISTFAHKPRHFEAIGESWMVALEKGGYETFADILMPWALGKSYYEKPIIPIEILKQIRQNFPMSVSRLQKLVMATATSNDYRDQLKNYKNPVLVVFGEEDLITTPEMGQEIFRNLVQAEWVLLKNRGHTLNLEAPNELVSSIRDFLKMQELLK
jgi:pimeloyl-ACP methyl ester carboxylesterase